jgi:hypothetical protein
MPQEVKAFQLCALLHRKAFERAGCSTEVVSPAKASSASRAKAVNLIVANVDSAENVN